MVFPAYVGMSPENLLKISKPLSVPRIRGDEPLAVRALKKHAVCSPHTWG